MIRSLLVPPGTTLFHLAAAYLGDATLWSRIAAINRIDNPFMSSISEVIIPVSSSISNRQG